MVDHSYLRENRDIIEKLNAIPILRQFKEKDLQGLMGLSKFVKYEPGELIVKEGQTANCVFLIMSGKVGIEKQGETIGILKRRGDIFGEMGIIDGSSRSASIIAIEETVCLVIDVSYVDRLTEKDRVSFNSILYRVFAEVLASRLRVTNEDLVRLKDENEMQKAEIKKLKAEINRG
ncbi:MAG: cyclic nucleotide-binding domain-containing protein [Pseudomonadota bacterium]